MKKVYISGRISGLKQEDAIQKFEAAEKALRRFFPNLKLVNPFKLHDDLSQPWEKLMARDIEELLTCDCIYLLDNWGKSKGARIEYAIARELGLTIIFE